MRSLDSWAATASKAKTQTKNVIPQIPNYILFRLDNKHSDSMRFPDREPGGATEERGPVSSLSQQRSADNPQSGPAGAGLVPQPPLLPGGALRHRHQKPRSVLEELRPGELALRGAHHRPLLD